MTNPYKSKVAALALSFVAVGFTSAASANPNQAQQASQTEAVQTQVVPPKPAVKAPKPVQKPPKKVKQKKEKKVKVVAPKPAVEPKQEVPVPQISVNPAGPVSTTTVTVETIAKPAVQTAPK